MSEGSKGRAEVAERANSCLVRSFESLCSVKPSDKWSLLISDKVFGKARQMSNPSKMPTFKKGDLVMSTVALPVARTALTKPGAAIQDPNNPQLYSFPPVPIDSAPVAGLLIQAGVIFEVDAVLPWNAPDNTSKRYRLVLNHHHWSQLDEQQRRLSEAEFASLNIILGEEDAELPFYTYADDARPRTRRGSRRANARRGAGGVWAADDYFPWNISVQFPGVEDVLSYDVQAWLYDDADDEAEGLWFELWLEPLYVSDPKQEPLLTLRVKPDDYLDFSSPSIEFQSERKAVCRIDVDEAAIQITIQFRIHVDLEQLRWQFLE